MKFKKYTALFMVIAMAVSLFTGCVQKIEGNIEETTQVTVGEDGREMIGNMYKTGLPIVKEPVTLTMVVRRNNLNKKAYAEKDIYKQFEKDTNVKIDWQEVPQTGWDEKINLLFASRSLPDAIYAGNIPNVSEQIEAKNIIPITPMIDDFAPNLKTMLEAYPEVKKSHTYEDGHIYAYIRYELDSYQDQFNALLINKTWLDALGLPIPTNTDEFYNVLKQFRDNDMNGNGKDDEIPLSLVQSGNTENLCELFGSWGVLGKLRNVKDGKVFASITHPGFLEALKYFHKLYAEGLLDQEIFTQTQNDLNAKGKAPEMIFGSYVGWNDDNVVGTDRINDYAYVPPLAGPNGDRLWERRLNEGAACFYITSANKYPEITLRWVDYLSEGKNAIIQTKGPEGIAWKVSDDGIHYEHIMDNVPAGGSWGELRNTEGGGGSAPYLDVPEVTGLRMKLDDRFSRKNSWTEQARPYLEKELYRTLKKVVLTDRDREMQIVLADIENYRRSFIAKAITEGITEKDWQEHLEKCKTLKVDEFIEYCQEEYDKYLAQK